MPEQDELGHWGWDPCQRCGRYVTQLHPPAVQHFCPRSPEGSDLLSRFNAVIRARPVEELHGLVEDLVITALAWQRKVEE